MGTQTETPGKTPAEIEREIEATRERMSEDIEAIGEKFTPEHIKYKAREALHGAREAAMERVQEVAGDVGRKTKEAGTGLMQMVRRNPVPAAMIGAGVAWMMAERGSSRSRAGRYRGRFENVRYGETGEGPSRLGGAVDTVKEKAQELTGQAGEKIQQLKEGATERARSAEREIEGFLDRSPLIAAAALAVLGAAIGVMLPRTDTEDRLLSGIGDKMAEKVRDTARDVTDKAKDVAHNAVENFAQTFDKDSPSLETGNSSRQQSFDRPGRI